MFENSKVIWSEGIFLLPQHFQQHDRYIQNLVNSRCLGLQPYGWGFYSLTIDSDLFKIGKLALKECKGIFPDGTSFNLPEDDEHVIEVSKYPIGIWLEFHTDSEHTIRCTLAAKIDTIDKYVFVNSQGVKVIEKSRMGLARELKAGTVKVISEGPLMERAMETVIGKLREGGS